MPGYDHLQLGIDAKVTGTGDVNKLNDAVKKGAEIAVWAGKETADAMGSIAHAYANAAKESAAFAASHPLLIAGIGKVTYEVGTHLNSVDKMTDAYRVLRLAASPTLFTGITLGAGLAVEAVLRNAEAVAELNRELAITAARSGQSFQSVLAMRTAGKIEGGDFSSVFAGKSASEVGTLVEQYKQLADPVEKAAFAVEHFGANAEKAMPMLRRGIEESVASANKFAGSVNQLDRESLERLSVRMSWIGDQAHKIAAGFREWWETETLGKRWFAMMAAGINDAVVNSGDARAKQMGLPGTADEMPSFTSVVKKKSDAEWYIRQTMMMQPVDSATLSRSDAAMAAYSASEAGIQGRLSSTEDRRNKFRDQLNNSVGTLPGQEGYLGNDEQSVRESYLRSTKEIAGLKAQLDAIQAAARAAAKAEADLARAQEAVAELGKRSAEAFMKAAVGDNDSPLGKYRATLGKIEVDRSDFLRQNPQASIRAETESYYKEQRNAAKMTLDADIAKLFDEFDRKGIEIGKHWVSTLETLGRDTVKAGEDLLREYPEIFGKGPALPAFGGPSPDQQLRDARDNERRSIGLYGSQAALGGVAEITQVRTMEALKQRAADEEYLALKRKADQITEVQAREGAQRDAIDQQHQKYLDAEIERQQALMQLALRQKQQFQDLAVGLVDSILHKSTSQFLQQQAEHLLGQVVGNAAGMIWKDVSKAIPHANDPNSTMGKLLQGTMFGADPLKVATDLNTGATQLNTASMDALNTRMSAMSASSGGGSAGGFAGYTRAVAAMRSGVSNFGGEYGSGDFAGNSSSASGGAGGMGGYTPVNWGSGEGGGPEGSSLPTEGMSSGGNSGEGGGGGVNVGQYAAAAGGVGMGIYGAITSPSTKGKLGSAGGGLMSLGAVLPPPAGPIVMGVGAALTVASAIMGDPKKQRAEEIDSWTKSHQFSMPDPVSIVADMKGRDVSYDMRGNLRPIQVINTTNNNVSSIDSQDVARFFEKNAAAVNKGVSRAIDDGGDLVPKMASALGLQ